MLNQENADALHIGEGTIKFHVNGILRKLDVSDRTQAVLSRWAQLNNEWKLG